jgi:hypothetical protein
MSRGHAHPASLPRDLETLLQRARRRDVLRLLGVASLFPLLGCGTEAGALDSATASANKRATSQLALPRATASEVYATSGYTGSAANLATVSLETDLVFANGTTLETPTVTGSVNSGYEAALTVGVVP